MEPADLHLQALAAGEDVFQQRGIRILHRDDGKQHDHAGNEEEARQGSVGFGKVK